MSKFYNKYVSWLFFMLYVWSNQVIVYGCRSSTRSDNTIYYTEHDKLIINFKLKKTPKHAVRYVVEKKSGTDKLDSISLKNNNLNNKTFTISRELLQFDNDNCLSITFFDKEENVLCVRPLPFHLKLKNEHYNMRNKEKNKHQCLTTEGCGHTIKEKCKNDDEVSNSFPITTEGANSDEVISHLNYTAGHEYVFKLSNNSTSYCNETKVEVQVGHKATFNCTFMGNPDKMMVTWAHKSANNYVITTIVGTVSLTIDITMDLFDNNTNLCCYALHGNGRNMEVVSNMLVHVTVPQSENVQQFEDRYKTIAKKLFASPNEEVKLDCSSDELILDTLLVFKDGVLLNTSKIPYTFLMSQEYNDTWFICIGYNSNVVKKRSIVSVKHILYIETDGEIEPSNTHLLIFTAISGIGVVVLLIAICYCCVQRKNRLAPHEVETYSTMRVQYVDLDLSPPSSTRNFVDQESPYAEIIGFIEPKNK